MLSTRSLLLSASLFSYALAQVKIAFITVPALVVAGESYNITWGGGDGTPVTVTLREGDPDTLKTIATLADSVSENYLVWNVSKSLETASDYTLQITQGQNEINYSGQFSIAGGSGTSTISYSGISTATPASNASTSMIGTTSTPLTSAGFSTLIASNATFSSATLSATTTSLAPAITQHMTSSAASSFGFGSEASSTAAASTAAATASAPDSAGAAQAGSSVALVLGVFAAVMFFR